MYTPSSSFFYALSLFTSLINPCASPLSADEESIAPTTIKVCTEYVCDKNPSGLAYQLEAGVTQGNLYEVNAALACGANPEGEDHYLYASLLHKALELHVHPSIMHALIKAGANVNIDTQRSDKESLLHLAVKWFNLPAVQLFLKAGADRNALNIFGQKPEDLNRSAEIVSLFANTSN